MVNTRAFASAGDVMLKCRRVRSVIGMGGAFGSRPLLGLDFKERLQSQRDALRRLAAKQSWSPPTSRRSSPFAKGTTQAVSLDASHIRDPAARHAIVSLGALHGLSNVNALAPGERLSFWAVYLGSAQPSISVASRSSASARANVLARPRSVVRVAASSLTKLAISRLCCAILFSSGGISVTVCCSLIRCSTAFAWGLGASSRT
jgi:hypothetical protein